MKYLPFIIIKKTKYLYHFKILQCHVTGKVREVFKQTNIGNFHI